MKKALAIVGAMFLAGQSFAEVPVVTNVVASQQGSNKLVNITYDVFDADGDLLDVRVEISDDGGATYLVPAFNFTGDIGDNVVTGLNKQIVWDAGTDWDGEYSDQMRAKVIASDAKGYPGLEFSSEVPAGGFLMGQDGGAEGSGPSRHVNIPWSYWFSKYEITVAQYVDFLNAALVAERVYRDGTTAVRAEPGQYPGVLSGTLLTLLGDSYDVRWNVNNFEIVTGQSNRPVRVTWYGALAFAKHYGYDLPTDAEWEKAARGPDHEDEGEHYVYPWGDTISAGNANYSASGDPFGTTTPVGYYDGNQIPFGPDMASAYGTYDIAGNVEEWCRSVITSVEAYPQTESLSNSVNTLSGSGSRVLRGGSHDRSASALKCYLRASTSSLDTYENERGFRVTRRSIADSDPVPTTELEEDFEDAAWTVQSNTWTVVASSGTWTANLAPVHVVRNAAFALSGTGAIQHGNPFSGSTASLELPPTSGLPVGMTFWARRVHQDSSPTMSIQHWNGFSWGTAQSVNIPWDQYIKIRVGFSFSSPDSGLKLRFNGYGGTYIDDVEIYTIPR